MTAAPLSAARLGELRAAYLAGSRKDSMTEPTRSRCRDAVAAIDELIELRIEAFRAKAQQEKDRVAAFTEAAKPLIRWMNENYHPHVSAIVTPTGAELVEGLLCTGRLQEFLKD